jgi:hypothetical protein
MKKKGNIVFAVIATLLVVYVISTLPNFGRRAEWNRTGAALLSVPVERVTTAASTFARDQKVTDATVPLNRLVSAGLLRPEDVRGLQEKDVAISLRPNETTPEKALIRVRASDGSDIALMADGSIRKMARR